MESLLFHFLDEWLYKFSADLFFIPRVSMLASPGVGQKMVGKRLVTSADISIRFDQICDVMS